MRKILPIALALILVSCSPFQRLVMVPSYRSDFLTDNCDVVIINRLNHLPDTTGSFNTSDYYDLPERFAPDSCVYYASRIYFPQGRDSSFWLLTIRPATIGKEEIIIGNLYTLYPGTDSTMAFERRIKEYSQTKQFESGKYLGFTYYLKNDSIEIIKLGTRMF